MLYLTGDTHGDNLGRFSFRRRPGMRSWTEDDVAVVLGDTALMWPGYEKETAYVLDQLVSKPFAIVFILGNHDNYDWAETLPQVDVFGGTMRQIVVDGVTYENRFIVDSWTVADLSGYHCLLCAHAKSHDIDHLYQPDDKEGIAAAKRRGEWFRVAHKTWWPQEELDIGAIEPFIQEHENERFDAILTHDCPGMFCSFAGHESGARMKATEQERYFDDLRRRLDYGIWAHGHMHHEWFAYKDYESFYKEGRKRMLYCVYHEFFAANRLLEHDIAED